MMTEIPFYDFGGAGERLHFAHSNGFPPASFKALLGALALDYRVLAMELRPLWAGYEPEELDNWNVVADDLLRFLDQQGWENIIGMGHSLGAVATMMAALKEPERFKVLVLVEPVFLPPPLLEMAAAHPGAAEMIPLVKATRRRRYEWPDEAAMFAHFRKKETFVRWSDEALWDYVRAGSEAGGAGVQLRYRRDWEARFYSLPPTTVWADIPQIKVPTMGVRGALSDTIAPESWALWQELQPEGHFVEMAEAGHMVPVERPFALADTIKSYLTGMV
ncbi:MAG TPA: alpha/beta hydrolase [Anaerolineae bacterium]|nr:alpha/beta hydrolase [Anaerolineae bacterium]